MNAETAEKDKNQTEQAQEETKAPEISEPEALKFTDEELQSLQSLQS